MKNIWITCIYAFILTSCYDFSLPKYNPDANLNTDESGVTGAPGGGDNGICGPGALQCNNSCVPNDARNCGTCGHDCTALPHVTGKVECVSGACLITPTSCVSGWANCTMNQEEGCGTDITKPANCGICGNNCSGTATPYCSPTDPSLGLAFECRAACPPYASTACPDYSCADVNTSPNNCGGCGIRCEDTQGGQATCAGGTCGTVCKDGYHDCAGKCLSNTSTDSCGTSCESCEVPLNSTPTCDGTKCAFKCKEGYLACEGKCVANDKNNCGSCGHDCEGLKNVSGAVTCEKGACSILLTSCAPGYANCDSDPNNGCETKLSDAKNCGACGTVCASPTPVCSLKSDSTKENPAYGCIEKCASNETKCDTSCVNTATSALHCGNCDKACEPVTYGQPVCVDGKCTVKCNSGYHDCNGKCVSNKAPETCGTQCTPCEKPTNATATCDGTKCNFTCSSDKYLKCESGCFPNDAKNCGECGNDCGTKKCDGKGNCVECLSSSDCKSSSAKVCVDNACKACDPDGSNTCGLCKKCSAQGSCVNQSSGEDQKNECQSGSCTTGSCNGSGACEVQPSNTRCGFCKACNASGSCSNVANGQDPAGDCEKTASGVQASECKDGFCGGNGECSTSGTAITCYLDSDGDGYGDKKDTGSKYCGTCPSGMKTDHTDCNDDKELAHPGQRDYFPTPVVGGTNDFDYNCINGNEKEPKTCLGGCKSSTSCNDNPQCQSNMQNCTGECGAPQREAGCHALNCASVNECRMWNESLNENLILKCH